MITVSVVSGIIIQVSMTYVLKISHTDYQK